MSTSNLLQSRRPSYDDYATGSRTRRTSTASSGIGHNRRGSDVTAAMVVRRDSNGIRGSTSSLPTTLHSSVSCLSVVSCVSSNSQKFCIRLDEDYSDSERDGTTGRRRRRKKQLGKTASVPPRTAHAKTTRPISGFARLRKTCADFCERVATSASTTKNQLKSLPSRRTRVAPL